MNEFNYEGWVHGNMIDTPPASADAEGAPGQMCIDEDYIYVCVDTDTWKRAALSTW